MAEYKVQFEVFEGPLDLLLYLIKKEEVDIYEVNLTRLATQFIEYIDTMRLLDLEIAGEFLVMASTLMFIKSRELLPVEQQVVVEGEDEGEDPRWELIRQLVEYKKFKDAAAQLQAMEARQEDVFPRVPAKLEFHTEAAPAKLEVSIFDLLNAVNSVLKRFQQKEAGTREIYEDKWTVSEKIEYVISVITERGSVKFSELFAGAANRAEVVCTFLALLELIRLKQLACTQPEPFSEIEIGRAPIQPAAEAEPLATEAGAVAEAGAITKPTTVESTIAEPATVSEPVADAEPPAEPLAESPVEPPVELQPEPPTDPQVEPPAEISPSPSESHGT
jgi:segregation and condensation protein A